jgi:hypothetical protein
MARLATRSGSTSRTARQCEESGVENEHWVRNISSRTVKTMPRIQSGVISRRQKSNAGEDSLCQLRRLHLLFLDMISWLMHRG